VNKRTSPVRVLHASRKLTGRDVVGLVSDNHVDRDIAAEVFIVEPVGTDPAVPAAIAVGDWAPG
jgi:hypothetical protein